MKIDKPREEWNQEDFFAACGNEYICCGDYRSIGYHD